MSKSRIPTSILLAAVLFQQSVAQQKPWSRSPAVAPNRIEVRFAIDESALSCRSFDLVVQRGGNVVVKGKFSLGFDIPDAFRDGSVRGSRGLDIRIKCQGKRWHFRDVPEQALLHGWWWVGIDYPPFDSEFKGDKFRDVLWIKYLITDPNNDTGFVMTHACPKELKKDKNGPCFKD
jgi:hypothetical protein